jgi:glycosyltransferase involved in cell wall biosynthesis
VFHDNTGFGDRDRRVFNRTVVTHRAYLFRKNFPQTRLARAQFRMLISALVVHRLVNGDLAGMRGLYDGMQALRRGQSPGAVREASGRVLFVSSHAGGGGSERYLAQLLERLPSRTIDAVVALQAGPLIERLRHNAVDVSVVSTGPSALAILAAAWKLRRTVRRRRSRLIHANGVKAAAVAVTAVRGLDIPVVWVKHDHSFDGRIARWIARRCSLVVGVSRSVLRSVEATSATRVVAPGIAVPPVERASARAELSRLVGRGRVVLLVGRLDRAKGHDQAIEVIARVRQRVADARLVFVGAPEAGQPEYADQLAELAIARGVGEAVTVLGYRDDAQRLIRGADALLIMSRATGRRGAGSEGHPLVAVEALTLGTPVLGYAIGGLPEVVGECGVLVAPGDLVALSDALVGLLEDDERRRCLSDCGRARASRFDPGSTASAMSEIYRELMPR